MAQFLDPFTGMKTDRPLTPRELTRAIRMAIGAEEEAIHHYEAIADSIDNELASKVLQDIANEEKVHVGELQKVLNLLDAEEEGFLKTGEDEVSELGSGIPEFREWMEKRDQ